MAGLGTRQRSGSSVVTQFVLEVVLSSAGSGESRWRAHSLPVIRRSRRSGDAATLTDICFFAAAIRHFDVGRSHQAYRPPVGRFLTDTGAGQCHLPTSRSWAIGAKLRRRELPFHLFPFGGLRKSGGGFSPTRTKRVPGRWGWCGLQEAGARIRTSRA